jgi:putative phage-type endonuclease
VTISTELAGDIASPAAGRPDAPTARLVLPASASYEEWLDVRRSGIGGSDVAAILGLDGFRSPRHVYEAKHGRGDDGDSEAAEVGREIEDFIAYMFTRRSGVETAPTPGTLANLTRPWMLANVDRFALDPRTGEVLGPVELKNRSEYQAEDWEGEQPPDGPALQCHWYMAVGGWSHGYVAGLVGGNKLRWFRLERNEELIGYLIEACERWWRRHVVEGFPPPPDGHPATKPLLARLWDVKVEDVVQVSRDRARVLRARREALRAQAKAIGEELALVENTMRLICGEAGIARAGRDTAWTYQPTGTFASSRFREEQPELAAQYTRSVEAVDTARLQADHPEIYERYRARVLHVPPAKGLQ